jgi:hypothetical protein
MEDEEDVIVKKQSNKVLYAIIILAILIIATIVLLPSKESEPKTIDDLHLLNIEGKLKPDQGYIYKGLSFINYEGIWYTQFRSQKGTRLYDSAFRFGPKEAEEVPVEGFFDITSFDNSTNYYVTFDPLGSQFNYVAVAIADFNQNMMAVFDKIPIAACDKNETSACVDRPIINCSNTNEVVLYVKERNQTKIVFEDNCINVEGSGLDLVKAVDKVLYIFYGI